MKTNPISKIASLALAAALASPAAYAAPVVYVETDTGTGSLPGGAEDAASSGFGELRIRGSFVDATGGFAPNVVDLFGFTITTAGRYFFDTAGSDVADTQLFLFDAAGKGLTWNNDRSTAPVDTWSALDAHLDIGNYFIAVSMFGLDPFDDLANSIFDTLGNGGGANAGTGALSGWNDFSGASVFDRTNYVVTAYVPAPGALGLALAALGLMAGVSARTRRSAG
ncbi:MAG: hypothetical protein O9343_01575 [Burkholderiaceae bacterium]|jgi:hypothetical protein|nr:hypothetical protein [Burkholderiaceae bacterium]